MVSCQSEVAVLAIKKQPQRRVHEYGPVDVLFPLWIQP